MSCLIIVVFYSLLVYTYADFNVTRRVPNATLVVTNTTQSFTIEIDQPVNRPVFSALICVCNASSNTSVYQIDVRNSSNTTVAYSNNSLTFSLPQSFYNTKNEFYITFDAGVFFSGLVNSTTRNDSQFWHLRVVDIATTTIGMTYQSSDTSTSRMTGSSMLYTDTSVQPITTMPNISTTINQTAPTATPTTASTVSTNTGEPPPTRSAQLGMGLGITFISIAIIAEIIYFKYCYSGGERSGSYHT